MDRESTPLGEAPGPFTGPHRIRLESWISTAPFERHLGMEILEAEEGRARLTMPFLAELAQGGGLMHGGALVALADTAVAMAIKSLLPPRTHFVTVSMESRFLRPVRQGVVTARASVEFRGERTLRGEAIVYDDEEKQAMEFASVFKIPGDGRLRGVTVGS